MSLIKDIQNRQIQKKANQFILSLKGKSDEEVKNAFLNNKEFQNNEIVLSYIFFNHTSLISILPNDFQKSRINSNLTMFNYGSKEVRKSLITDWIHNNKLINNSLVIGFKDEEFNSYALNYFDNKDDLTLLHMEDLKRIVSILNDYDENETANIINDIKDKFTDRQWEFIIDVNPKFIKYASQSIQTKYCTDQKYVKYLTGSAKNDFINSQIEKIKEDFSIFDTMDINIKLEFIKKCPYMINNLKQEDIILLLKEDINLIKYVNLSSFNGDVNNSQDFVFSLIEDLSEKSNTQIIDILINKNLFNAKGKLYRYDKNSNNVSYQYTKKIIKVFQDLKLNQIIILTNVDSNYILPYIVPLYPLGADNGRKKDEVEKANGRCILAFQNYYNPSICNNYMDVINKIYEEYLDNIDEYYYEEDYKCILDLFKVLFNKSIINNNSVEDVTNYINECLKYKNTNDKNIIYKLTNDLNNLLTKAYNTKIENNREIYNINSLELFDNRLLFISRELLTDFSKYNFVNISNLLLIIKSQSAYELFKTYYRYMLQIHGENNNTLYKTIENFNYFKDILEDVSNNKLNDKEINGLILLLSDYTNKYNIKEVSELDNYDILLFKNLVNEISSVKDENLYKNLICNYLFSKCYNNKSDPGWLEMDTIESLCNIYDVDSLRNLTKDNINVFTEDEVNLFSMTKLLFSSNDFDLLLSFVENIINKNVKKNSLSTSELFNKIQDNRLELINSEIVSISEIRQLYLDRPDLVIKNKKEGVDVYSIIGQDFRVLISENNDGINYLCQNVSEIEKNSYAYDKLSINSPIRFSNNDGKTQIKLSKDIVDKNNIDNPSYIIVTGLVSNELINIAKENKLDIVEIRNE